MIMISVTIIPTGMSARQKTCSTVDVVIASHLLLHSLIWQMLSDMKPRLSPPVDMDGPRSKEKSAIQTGQKALEILNGITA